MQNRLDFGLAMYHKSSTAVHWLQNTRDENCFLGLQWLYLKSRILITDFCLCFGLSWALQYKGAECLGQHVSKNTQAKFMLLLLPGGLGISAAFPVGSTGRGIIYIRVSTYSCFETWGPMQRSLEARGDICLFRWTKNLSRGCVEAILILSSLDLAWFCIGGGDTLRAASAMASSRDFCLPAGAVLLQLKDEATGLWGSVPATGCCGVFVEL